MTLRIQNQPVAIYRPDASCAITTLESAARAHLEVRALYLECVSHLLCDDAVAVHVLIAPNMTGDHQVYSGEDVEMAEAVAALTDAEVGPMDCIVVLGRDMLSVERNEDEMAAVVAADLALHVSRLWPVADRSLGWVGPHVGWAAVAGLFVSAHPILRDIDLHDTIRSAAAARMCRSMYSGCKPEVAADRLARENAPAGEAVSLILESARATFGSLISLPARVCDVVEAGRRMMTEVIDDMEVRPVGVI